MRKNYNNQRKKLQLPEYGRHIHEMVEHILTISDKDARSRQAKTIIAVMGNQNPLLRDNPDFAHKIWDHLFIISDFQLDIESPYPIPTAKSLAPTPKRLQYPLKRIKMKHYGKNIEKVLLELQNCDDANSVELIIGNIAKYMRTKSYEYNQEHPSNSVIIKDIKRLSENTISINEEAIGNLKSEYKSVQTSYIKSKQVRGKVTKNPKISSKPQYRQRPNPSR